jgi:hypothetical protein
LNPIECAETSDIKIIDSDAPENETEAEKILGDNTEVPIEPETSEGAEIDEDDAENNDDNLSVSSMSTTRENEPELEVRREVEAPAGEAPAREISSPFVEEIGRFSFELCF